MPDRLAADLVNGGEFDLRREQGPDWEIAALDAVDELVGDLEIERRGRLEVLAPVPGRGCRAIRPALRLCRHALGVRTPWRTPRRCRHLEPRFGRFHPLIPARLCDG